MLDFDYECKVAFLIARHLLRRYQTHSVDLRKACRSRVCKSDCILENDVSKIIGVCLTRNSLSTYLFLYETLLAVSQ